MINDLPLLVLFQESLWELQYNAYDLVSPSPPSRQLVPWEKLKFKKKKKKQNSHVKVTRDNINNAI
jgi:hypothetical protein